MHRLAVGLHKLQRSLEGATALPPEFTASIPKAALALLGAGHILAEEFSEIGKLLAEESPGSLRMPST